MKFFLFILIVFSIASCNTVHFNEPQPKNGTRLYSFPEALQGSWTDNSGESMTITASQIISENFQHDSLGNIIDTSYKYESLSDTIQLYEKDGFFVFNEQYADGSFRIMIAHPKKNGDIGYYFCDEPQVYNKMRGLKIDSADLYMVEYVSEIDDFIEYDTLLVAPQQKELYSDNVQQVSSVYYSGQVSIRQFKKICREEFIYFILKSDGTVYVPESGGEEIQD